MDTNELVKRLGIKARAERVSDNPDMTDSARHPMDHWQVTLSRRDAGKTVRMSVRFSMGLGFNGAAPKAADVVDSLLLDAGTVENAENFEEWALDLGYDPDSRKAERTYRTIKRQAIRLRRFLGDQYETAVNETDRL